MNMQLKDRQIVIIGGSSGIGLATAQMALNMGANVTITGRNSEKLQRATTNLSNVRTVVADVSNKLQIEQIFQDLKCVDHLFLTAGSLRTGENEGDGKIATTAIKALKYPIEERIFGAIYTIHHALAKMSEGSITLMSGLFSTRPISGVATIAAAVAGIEAMTRTLALELAPICVNAVCPGYIDTPLLQAAFGDRYEQITKLQAESLPVKRIGTAEEVAEAVLLLMTNKFITGEVLHIDGGGRLI
jgi:NAD(P)-dependent dehydrogenase (short-subunit alcohol dehydrogenase family)